MSRGLLYASNKPVEKKFLRTMVVCQRIVVADGELVSISIGGPSLSERLSPGILVGH